METVMLMPLRTLFLAVSLAAALPAAEGFGPLAAWSVGEGRIAGAAAASGQPIAAGVEFASSAGHPARVALTAVPGSTLTLGPGAALRLVEEFEEGKGRHLVIELARGALQLDLAGHGDYLDVHVRGAALDVRVTGTLFVVDRIRRDADYVALVQGKVKVGLRKEVAEALGKKQEVDLSPRQGVGGTTGGGLGGVDGLNNRPQVDKTANGNAQDQGNAPPQGDGGWGSDLAGLLLDGGDGFGGPGDGLGDQFTDDLGKSLLDDLGNSLTDQVLQINFGDRALAPPPGPP
jgi:hypothetical protein